MNMAINTTEVFSFPQVSDLFSGIDGFFPVFRNLWEGTGTRPDYLVNRVLTKNEGPLGKKIAQKSRNSWDVNGRDCGCIGTVDSRRNLMQS